MYEKWLYILDAEMIGSVEFEFRDMFQDFIWKKYEKTIPKRVLKSLEC